MWIYRLKIEDITTTTTSTTVAVTTSTTTSTTSTSTSTTTSTTTSIPTTTTTTTAAVPTVFSFPNAYGPGAYVTGGRAGNVYIVTNLANSGAGSFRDAVSQSDRIIVFNVSGTIQLTSNLVITKDNITVAGQSAPEGGITFCGEPIYFSGADNHIWRYIRFRPTQTTISSEDALNYTNSTNIIFDHCSISYGGDGAFSPIGNASDLTIQNSILGESQSGMIVGDETIEYDSQFSLLRNVFFNIGDKLPNINGRNTDVINNVVYNWNSRLMVMSSHDNSQLNEINNYYFPGTKTGTANAPDWAINLVDVGADSSKANISIHTSGNVLPGYLTAVGDSTTLWKHSDDVTSGSLSPLSQYDDVDPSLISGSAFTFQGRAITPITAEESLIEVVQDAGANKFLDEEGRYGFNRDSIDEKYVNYIATEASTDYAVPPTDIPSEDYYLDFQNSITGTPINTRSASYDTNNDGIPDVWSAANLGGNNAMDIAPSGFTYLEEFLNSVDDETNEKIKAFPTAQGAGKYVTGGRGGIIVKVTNLNDSGVGSLRAALLMTVPRIIVFDVSGTITLLSAIELIEENSNFTVAGQTAPEGGITVSNNLIQIGGGWSRPSQPCNNIIIRYIRFRNGRYTGVPDVREHNGIVVTGCNGWVVDHCSFSFCDDQAIAAGGDWGDFKNVTIQRSIFSENATQIILSLNGAEDERDFTVYENAFIDTSQRTPNVGGDGQCDVINNFYFNWASRLMNLNSSTPQVNFIANYMEEGSFTTSGSGNKYQNGVASIYTAMNYHSDLYTTPQLDDRNIWQNFSDDTPVSSSRFTTVMHPILGDLNITKASNVPDILNDIGANRFLNLDGTSSIYQDSFDTTKISNAQSSISSDPYNKVWTLPTLPSNTRAAGYDSGIEGIPDVWRIANMPGGDGANDIAPSGYTWIEEYINSF